MTRIAALCLALAAALGCTVSEGDFPERYADADCRKARRCDREQFNETWDDLGDCLSRVEDNIDTLVAVGGFFSDYDEERGWECVRAIDTASCDDYLDGDVTCDVFD